MNAQIALMNPGGIRANIDAGTITWGDLFTVEPFGNQLIQLNLTGAQIKAVLEQQWANPTQTKFLQVSGITESWDPGQPRGSRISSLEIAGTPIDPNQTYTVVANSFLAGGGDGFTAFTGGTNQVVGPVDLDALVNYVQASARPVDAPVENRITKP